MKPLKRRKAITSRTENNRNSPLDNNSLHDTGYGRSLHEYYHTYIPYYIIIYAALLTLVGCGGGKSVRQQPHLGNTPYQQDTILVTYVTNPERALTLLDSALLLGNISEYRGQCIRLSSTGWATNCPSFACRDASVCCPPTCLRRKL